MRDELFIRGNVPMTKSEVRAVSLSKLELQRDSILYDIGAGTGSVSIEAALQIPDGHVYAVERKRDAAALIQQNMEKFHITNLSVVMAEAPDKLDTLPAPTHVFLGGSGGNMEAILDHVRFRSPAARIVTNVITLESLAKIMAYVKSRNLPHEVVSIQIARGELAGNYHLMKSQNPVYIISIGGEGKEI